MKIEFGKGFFRLGSFFIGRLPEPPEPPEPRFLPEMIVCRDGRQARKIRLGLPGNIPPGEVVIVTPRIAEILGTPPVARVIVLPGVDLDANVAGHGRLRDLLAFRQCMWGPRSVLVDLSGEAAR